MRELKVYTQEGCGYCDDTKDHLKENNIEFTNKDTELFSDEWNAIMAITGIGMTPTLIYGNNILIQGRDFNSIEEIPFALKVYDNIYNSNSSLALEKIKSFEYNISEAMRIVLSELAEIKEKLNKE